MLKTFFACALVLLVTLTNLTMVCVEHAPPARSPGADCSEMCPRNPPGGETKTGCVLVAGGCAAVTAFVIAAHGPSPGVPAAPDTMIVRPWLRPDLYRSLTSSPSNPPPEL